MSDTISSLFPAQDPSEPESSAMLRAHIAQADFPCVGAKAAMARGTLEILGARDIASAWDDLRIHDCLRRFAERYRAEPQLFRSLAVVFAGPDTLDEAAFERAVWSRIQSLSDKDVWLGQDWDERVSADPDDPHFSLSFGGEAFFVVGLHPKASRPARRFPRPAMIFKWSKNQADAKAFIDYMLSDDGQKAIAAVQLMPARTDVEADRPLINDLTLLDAKAGDDATRKEILARFASIFAAR